jgi:hypothetical protein
VAKQLNQDSPFGLLATPDCNSNRLYCSRVDYPPVCMYPEGMTEDSQSDRRPSERKRVQMAVILVIESDEVEHLATAVDLSSSGLRLQSDATLAPGQPVGLLLATEPLSFVKSRVVWVGKADSVQAGQAGFEFLNPQPGPER